MTERIYYTNPYQTRFETFIAGLADEGRRVRLERSAFYPTSGGQEHDLGTISGIPVTDVIDEDDGVVHVLDAPLSLGRGEAVVGEIDWPRRFDHMQQHTGQHLLSATLADLFGWETVSVHMGTDISTVEVATTSTRPTDLAAAELRANEIVFENRPVSVSFEEASQAKGLRKASGRTGILRIVTIDGLDRSACGGTHVQSTGEIGPVLLRRTEKIRGNTRIEFLCGLRAIRRARRDFDALSGLAAALGSPVNEAAVIAAGQTARLADAEKALRRLTTEAAQARGRDCWSQTALSSSGIRYMRRDASELGDEVRAEAQGFTGGTRAVYLACSTAKPSVLLAVSPDAGLHAGNLLKSLLAQFGGKGGGSAQMAQGSLPDANAAEALSAAIASQMT